MIRSAPGQGLNTFDVQSQRRCKVEMTLEDLVPRVRSAVTERQFVAGILHVFGEVLGEERIVEIADHQGHQACSHTEQFGMGCMDLVAAQ